MKNLYVGNLPHSANELGLRNLFQLYGGVDKVSIMARDTGRSRGFAFVEMTDIVEADKAITALNGSNLEGRTLIVNEANPKPEGSRGGSRAAVTTVTSRASVESHAGNSAQVPHQEKEVVNAKRPFDF